MSNPDGFFHSTRAVLSAVCITVSIWELHRRQPSAEYYDGLIGGLIGIVSYSLGSFWSKLVLFLTTSLAG
eukprot:scaffold1315_cov93-Cylindrotheca_fusiformis.AAC.1